MKYLCFHIVLLLSCPLAGQMTIQYDTIRIKEVVISRSKSAESPIGYKSFTVDSTVIENYSNSSISELLAMNTSMFVKNYGLSGSASPSFRGTGASHTQVLWNNININHPMLGQSDLSLLTVGLIDDVQILYGGSSMGSGSGGIGGSINLETKPLWKKETLVSVHASAGSFGRYNSLVKARFGNEKFQSVTKLLLGTYENDFPYWNRDFSAEPVLQKREYNQKKQKAFIQELYYKLNKKTLSARVWYQSADRNLAPSILSLLTKVNEFQFDESLRAMAEYKQKYNTTEFIVTGSWIYNKLNYSNYVANINSDNISQTSGLKAEIKKNIGLNTKLNFILDDSYNYIRSNNYDHNLIRNTFSLTAIAEYSSFYRLGARILVREIFDRKFLIPDFSTGIQYRIFKGSDYLLTASVSRNSRIPSLNELFWVPGGNPELKNEFAYTYEMGYKMKHKISSNSNVDFDISLYKNTIRDMIQWHPGEYSFWIADNIKNVNSSGIESTLLIDYLVGDFSSQLLLSYTYNKATTISSYNNNDDSSDKQLLYTPNNLANSSIRLSYRKIYATSSSSFTGIRYTSVDNESFLPAYFLSNISAGVKLKIKNGIVDFNMTVNNLLNSNYQTIAYYPQPGRAFIFKVLIKFLK